MSSSETIFDTLHESKFDPQLGGVSPSHMGHNGASVDVGDQASNLEVHHGIGESHTDADEEMDDLFGNDADTHDVKPEGVPSSAASRNESERLTTPEAEHRRAMEYAEEEDEPDTIVAQRQEADVSIPNIPLPQSSDGDYWVIRTPTYVTVDSKPYHPDYYDGPDQDEDESLQTDSVNQKGNIIKLKVQNTVRWRWIKDESGNDRRQSNSRIIRWSDGTLSFRLGKEFFDVVQDIDTSGAIVRQSLGASQASQPQIHPALSQSSQLSSQVTLPSGKSQGLTYLVAQHKRAEILQAEAAITGFMSLRPTGMQSETHRMLVRAVGQKHNKVARLRMAPDPTMDPEREKLELIKQSAKKSRKKLEDDGFTARKRRSGYSDSPRKRGHEVYTDDEDEGDYEGSGDEDADVPGSSKKARSRGIDDARRGGEYQTDDFVVADSSEEEADGSEGGKRKRRRDGGDEYEDPLDKLEAKIQEREVEERKRRRRDSGGSKDSEEGMDGGDGVGDENAERMDIESEEDDDEEPHVRRAGAGGTRRKRAHELEEEEE